MKPWISFFLCFFLQAWDRVVVNFVPNHRLSISEVFHFSSLLKSIPSILYNRISILCHFIILLKHIPLYTPYTPPLIPPSSSQLLGFPKEAQWLEVKRRKKFNGDKHFSLFQVRKCGQHSFTNFRKTFFSCNAFFMIINNDYSLWYINEWYLDNNW